MINKLKYIAKKFFSKESGKFKNHHPDMSMIDEMVRLEMEIKRLFHPERCFPDINTPAEHNGIYTCGRKSRFLKKGQTWDE